MAAVTPENVQNWQHVINQQANADTKQMVQSVQAVTSPQPQQVLQPLPPGWMEMKDPSGRPLYVNPATGQSSWERPAPPALLPGWQRMQTPEGKVMFVHLASGTVSYEQPVVQPASTQALVVSNQPEPPKQTKVVVHRPASVRKAVAPGAPQTHTVVKRVISPPTIAPIAHNAALSVNVDMGAAVQAMQTFPGVYQAQQVHQLSENNNVAVLSKKLASDMAQTSITAASLATRQAKTVGKILMSPKNLQKFSKKMVVQTGAMSVKAGRACKVVMNEMVDAADGKGNYAAKPSRPYVPFKAARPYAPFNATLSMNAMVAGNGGNQAKPAQLQITHAAVQSQPNHVSPVSHASPTYYPPQANANLSMNVGIPIRKPLRKPVGSSTPVSPTAQPNIIHGPITPAQVEVAQAQSPASQPNADLKPTFHPRPSISGDVGNTPVPFQTSASPTASQLNGEMNINVQSADGTANLTSPVAPPSYQQAVSTPLSSQQHPMQALNGSIQAQINTSPMKLETSIGNIQADQKPPQDCSNADAYSPPMVNTAGILGNAGQLSYASPPLQQQQQYTQQHVSSVNQHGHQVPIQHNVDIKYQIGTVHSPNVVHQQPQYLQHPPQQTTSATPQNYHLPVQQNPYTQQQANVADYQNMKYQQPQYAYQQDQQSNIVNNLLNSYSNSTTQPTTSITDQAANITQPTTSYNQTTPTTDLATSQATLLTQPDAPHNQTTSYTNPTDTTQYSSIDPTSVSTITQPQPTQGVLYDTQTTLETDDVTVTEEEIVYVDEDGNVLTDDMLTVVDENTGEVYMYEECDVNGQEVYESEAVGQFDVGGGDVDVGGSDNEVDVDVDVDVDIGSVCDFGF